MRKFPVILGLLTIGGLACAGSAAVVQTPTYVANEESFSDIPASGTSLIQAGSATLLSASSTTSLSGDGFGATNDGAVGGIAYADITYTLTYVLDTSVNTNGYDIASIATISGWTATRIGQLYDVTYTDINNNEFALVSSVLHNPDAAGSLKVELTDDTGLLASGVKSISFTMSKLNFGTVYQELEVEGSPTVPEPSILGVAGLGATLLLRRRR